MFNMSLLKRIKIRKRSIFSVARCWRNFITAKRDESREKEFHSKLSSTRAIASLHLLLLFSVNAISDILNDIFFKSFTFFPVRKTNEVD